MTDPDTLDAVPNEAIDSPAGARHPGKPWTKELDSRTQIPRPLPATAAAGSAWAPAAARSASKCRVRGQPKQCSHSIRVLPRGSLVGEGDAGGLGELDVYGNNDGDLGGPVYVFTPDRKAVYILGMVVNSSGSCDLDGCHGKVLFRPVHDIEQALGAQLVTNS